MKSKIVATTVPQGITGVTTAEEFIAYAARVSNPKNQDNGDTALRLVKYLIREKHWSPFEMVHVTMEVNTTRDIARQLLRHRSFSFQEFSQRYASVEQLGDIFELRECRIQDTKNRQNSIDCQSEEIQEAWDEIQCTHQRNSERLYKEALDLGVAKEQARAVLPEGFTKSRLYVSGTLRSWIHYCELRIGNGTQKEHQEIAQECWDALKEVFPNVIGACESEVSK